MEVIEVMKKLREVMEKMLEDAQLGTQVMSFALTNYCNLRPFIKVVRICFNKIENDAFY